VSNGENNYWPWQAAFSSSGFIVITGKDVEEGILNPQTLKGGRANK